MIPTYRWVPPARYDWLRMISDAPHWRTRREQLDDELHEIHAELQLLATPWGHKVATALNGDES